MDGKTRTENSGMRRFFQFITLLVLAGTVVTCKKESSISNAPLDSIAKENFSFVKSLQASNEANQLRSADYSAPFEISKVERNNAMLTLTVTYPEGCGDSNFQLIWNGLTLETYPETVILYLRRTTVCGSTGSNTSRILNINLTTSLGDAALAQRVKIILCNSGKKANSENSDITVSSN